MNVLKPDFISRQKRLQGQRQKNKKTFFSGYHTISNIVPSGSYFKLPITSGKSTENQYRSSPKFPISFSTAEESVSVEPRSVETYSSDFITSENGVPERLYCRIKQDSTTSTSLEFQKLLEPFLSFRQDNLPDTSEEHFERNRTVRNSEKILPKFKLTGEEHLNSIFPTDNVIGIENDSMKQKSPDSSLQHLMNFNKETFEQYNIHWEREKQEKKQEKTSYSGCTL